MQGKNTIVFVTGKNPGAAELVSKEINEDKDFVSVAVPFDSLVSKPKIFFGKTKRVLNNHVWKPVSAVLHKVFRSIKVAETMRSYDGGKKQSVHNMIYRFSPTVLVVSEPYVLFSLSENLKSMGKKANLFVFSNDIGFRFDLIHDNVLHYFVDNINVRNQLLQKGIFADKIDVNPLPINSAFFEEKDRDDIRQKMGIGKTSKVVLVCPNEKNGKSLAAFAAEHADRYTFVALCDAVLKEIFEEKGVTCFPFAREENVYAACDVVLSGYDPYAIKKAAALRKTSVVYGDGNETIEHLVAERKIRWCEEETDAERTLVDLFAQKKPTTEDDEAESEPVFDETDEKSAIEIADRMKELVGAMTKEEERY